MPEPIEFLIVQHVQAALRQIATANGYHFDVATFAVKLDPDQAAETLELPDGARPVILLEVKRRRWTARPAMQTRVVLPMTVHWIGDALPVGEAGGPQDEDRMRTYYRACADIERAVMQDVGRGGRAYDTRIVGDVMDTSTNGLTVYAMVDLEISLERTWGEPDAN